MTENRITLSPEVIVEKQFKIDTRGFSMMEVDDFLDIVIEDYEEFEKILAEKESEKNKLLDEILQLKSRIRELKLQCEIEQERQSSIIEASPIDMMKRIANLETEVFGKERN